MVDLRTSACTSVTLRHATGTCQALEVTTDGDYEYARRMCHDDLRTKNYTDGGKD